MNSIHGLEENIAVRESITGMARALITEAENTRTMNTKPGQIPNIPESAPFSTEQRAWLNGFLVGLFGDADGGHERAPAKPKISLPILFGSQTGTAEQLAKRLAAEAGRRDFEPRVLEMNGY